MCWPVVDASSLMSFMSLYERVAVILAVQDHEIRYEVLGSRLRTPNQQLRALDANTMFSMRASFVQGTDSFGQDMPFLALTSVAVRLERIGIIDFVTFRYRRVSLENMFEYSTRKIVLLIFSCLQFYGCGGCRSGFDVV